MYDLVYKGIYDNIININKGEYYSWYDRFNISLILGYNWRGEFIPSIGVGYGINIKEIINDFR